MENRDRDKMSKNTSSTPAGDVNRNTSSREGQMKNDTSAEFGQNIGRSESVGNEPNRRSGSDSSKSNLGSEESGVGRNSDPGSEH